MKNYGVEFLLNSRNITTDDFTWTTNFNISHYKNEITSLPQGQVLTDDYVWREGSSRYTWYMREFAGVNHETGAAQWYKDVKDKDGNVTGRELTEKYSEADRYEMGTSLPDFYAGLTNTFTYKDFSLGFQFYASVGGKIFNYLEQTTMNDGSSYGHQLNAKVLEAWRPDNKDSDIPQFIQDNTSKSNSTSSRFLYDGSFLRLRNINLGYNLPKEYATKVGLQSLRAFVNVDNVYTFTKYEGLDPEQGISGAASSFKTIPNVRTFTFGVKLGF